MKIMLTGLFSDKPIYRKFLIVVSLVLFSTIIFSMIGGLLVSFIYGINVIDDASSLSNLNDPLVISAMKLLQLVTTGLGMFIIPSIVATILLSKEPKVFISLNNKINTKVLLLSIAMIFVSVPLINLLVVINSQIQLPEFLSVIEQWMQSSEDHAAKLTESFLIMNSTSDLYYNLLIIALIPAIGEELLFRGVLQRLFKDFTKNIHWSIFITAALFSAIHMQFYGFLPRMFLGVLFGYLLIWSGSIWIPIVAHFVNNAAAVLFSYFASKDELPFNQDTIGTQQEEIPYTIISMILLAGFLYLIKKSSVKLNY